jgi:hypothetical protein
MELQKRFALGEIEAFETLVLTMSLWVKGVSD